MLISVVVPTHNRPELLLEAMRSIADQTYQNYEVVVIDDGSMPPVSHANLKEILGEKIWLYRHEDALGVPKAKNAGVNAARGEVILLLDDDDLLRPDALEVVFLSFSEYHNIDCLFMGVHPFGKYADGPSANRKSALEKVLGTSMVEESKSLYFFSGNLFNALLKAVPIDFQRPAARRGAWNIIGGFDEESLFSEPDWAIRAASICTIALTKNEITEWRIHDDNFGWPAGLRLDQVRQRQFDNSLAGGDNLIKIFSKEEKLCRNRILAIKRRQSDSYFSKAYFLRGKNRPEGIKALWNSFMLCPRLVHLKLLVKYAVRAPPSSSS